MTKRNIVVVEATGQSVEDLPVEIVERKGIGHPDSLCDALAENNINIYAISTSDTIDHTVMRMVVSDYRKALHVFEQHGTLVVEDDGCGIAPEVQKHLFEPFRTQKPRGTGLGRSRSSTRSLRAASISAPR